MEKRTRIFSGRAETAPVFCGRELCHWLTAQARSSGLSWRALLHGADIETTRGYRIMRGTVCPTRDEALRLAIALRQGQLNARLILKLACCQPLAPQIRRDAAILICLEKRMSLPETREFLEAHQLHTV